MDSMNSKITSPTGFDILDYSSYITIDSSLIDYSSMGTITISSTDTNYSSTVLGSPYANYTIASGGTSNAIWTTNAAGIGPQPSLKVTGNADFEGDITIKGHSLAKMLEDINKRLAILQPDPAKLEKFEALKKAYDHYKLLEALCHESD